MRLLQHCITKGHLYAFDTELQLGRHITSRDILQLMHDIANK